MKSGLYILLSAYIFYYSHALKFVVPGSPEKTNGIEEIEMMPNPVTMFEDQWLDLNDVGEGTIELLGDNTDKYLRHPDSRVIVSPKHKLAFCYIEKNACKEFNSLFNKMNNKKGTRTWGASSAQASGLSSADLTQEHGWTWATFFRDPVVRYASAFQSKCLQKEDNGAACEPHDARVRGKGIETIMKSFEYSVRRNANRTDAAKHNPHYGNQIDFCGGARSRHYDFIGLLEGNVNEQVQHMLQLAGVEGSAELANEFFPANSVRGHHSQIPYSQLYRDDDVKSKVISMYKADIQFVNETRSKHFSKSGHVMMFD